MNRNTLLEDDTLAEHLVLEVDAIMEFWKCVIKLQTSNQQVLPQKKKAWLWGALCFQ
jgi:hypothetical protein